MAYQSELESRLAKKTTKAIVEYQMIEDGDRVMVGLSGGKDSWALLNILDVLRQRAPIRFSLVAVNVDSGYKEYKHDVIARTCEARGWEYRIEHTGIGELIEDILDADQTPCSLCARLRRGVRYRIATEVGATKIALGHHADDFIETLLLNVFFAGALKAMPAKLVSDDGRHVVIRPLVLVGEEEARAYAKACDLPIIGCCCPACGDLGLQRQRVKRLLMELEVEHPGVKQSMLKALGNVAPRHLLDTRLNPPAELRRHAASALTGVDGPRRDLQGRRGPRTVLHLRPAWGPLSNLSRQPPRRCRPSCRSRCRQDRPWTVLRSPMKLRIALIVCAVLSLAHAAAAQQRPLVTEDPEPVGAGRILIEGGIDYSKDAQYPAAGLRGDLLRMPTIGVSIGISSIAELQIDGGFYNHLTITDRDAAPLSDLLTIDGDSTHDVEDLVVATKIRVIAESARHPALALRFATKLPNAENESGIGLDTLDFYVTALGAKTVQSVRIVANVGLGILSDPTSIARQNDVLTYGVSFARAITDRAEFVGEVNGRWSTRSGGPFPGTETRSLLNLGGRYTAGSLRLDGQLFFGLTTLDPTVGFGAGFTYVFNAFQVP
jgi:tRNA 2-thiocytidine biosynthesis protein TtcA